MPTFVASSPRAVVLLSGGLDSYTAGAIAARDGFELYALTVRYGQVHAREIEAARRVAAALGVRDGDIIAISSRRGRITIAVRLSKRVARHQVFVPMHYREAAANLLTNPALDPYAGIPEFKVCAVKLSPVAQGAEDLANAAEVSSHT